MQEEVSTLTTSPRAAARGLGVLLIQLGSPDAPTPQALRPYLRQFLSDRRIIAVPPWKWWFILNFFILPLRPAQSAAKYARIWDTRLGSPLVHWSHRQTELLQYHFPGALVRCGMQVGQPAVATVVDDMIRAGVERLLVLPMYPQYSATTTASALDHLFDALKRQRRVPALRIVPPFYEHPAYLDAQVALIKEELARLSWQPQHFLLSFHGIPVAYAKAGDPYTTHVKRTTFHLVRRLGWSKGNWTQSFQSRFGRQQWLKPYTEDQVRRLAGQGVKRLFVIMPGFTADCLETIDEIGHEAREIFVQSGGETLYACPCLNDRPAWIEAMKAMIEQEGQGWL